MSLLNQLQTNFPQLDFKSNYPLTKQAYFKIGGSAEIYLELDQKKQIIELISFCLKNNLKFTILGGASNVIINDKGISGLVLHLKNSQLEILARTNQNKQALIKVGAGLKTSLLVKKTTALGYTGLEFFLGIPGTVGGAVFNNAHYLENLISDHIHQVEIINRLGQVVTINSEECLFGYDTSRFHQSGEVILEVTFALNKGLPKKSQQLVKKATQYRAQTQPLGLPSSGCIFKNVPNSPKLKKLFPQFAHQKFVSAGFLIDQAGLKGTKVGGIEVSTKHAAFLINSGQGTAKELEKIIRLIKKVVKDEFGIQLKEEVFYLS